MCATLGEAAEEGAHEAHLGRKFYRRRVSDEGWQREIDPADDDQRESWRLLPERKANNTPKERKAVDLRLEVRERRRELADVFADADPRVGAD